MKTNTTPGISVTISRWLFGLILTLGSLTSSHAGGEGWLTNFEEAKKQAAAGGKDLLLGFTGSDWCPPCMALEKEVFSQKVFLAATKDKFVLVELDFPQEKQLDAETSRQNSALQEQYKIEGYPSVLLCDAGGKPYARTGYKEGGAKIYAAHLAELQAIRVKRDAAFAKVDKSKDNTEKAAALAEGLQTMEDDLIDGHYGELSQQIKQLDPEDKTGYAKIREAAMARKDAEAALQRFAEAMLIPMIDGKEYEKALTAAKTFLKENPAISEESRESVLLAVALAGPLENGDLKAAHAVIDQLAKEYPDGGIAKDIDGLKTGVTDDINLRKGGEEGSE